MLVILYPYNFYCYFMCPSIDEFTPAVVMLLVMKVVTIGFLVVSIVPIQS